MFAGDGSGGHPLFMVPYYRGGRGRGEPPAHKKGLKPTINDNMQYAGFTNKQKHCRPTSGRTIGRTRSVDRIVTNRSYGLTVAKLMGAFITVNGLLSPFLVSAFAARWGNQIRDLNNPPGLLKLLLSSLVFMPSHS